MILLFGRNSPLYVVKCARNSEKLFLFFNPYSLTSNMDDLYLLRSNMDDPYLVWSNMDNLYLGIWKNALWSVSSVHVYTCLFSFHIYAYIKIPIDFCIFTYLLAYLLTNKLKVKGKKKIFLR